MAFRSQNRWQYGKTALENYRYMLDNEIATDVCFEIRTTVVRIVRIRAHRCMLISRSEVFQGMFSSGMIETRGRPEAMIRIVDIEPDVFKEMLRFIYSDSADINSTSALNLMYAAKKYMLHKLVQLCSECVRKGLTKQMAQDISECSFLFDEKEKDLEAETNASGQSNKFGWQYGKTALESHMYMLDNEIATDVCFEVRTTGDTIVRIRAHKVLLISRREIFEAMSSIGMVETQGGPEAIIRIEGIEPDVVKKMLRFIYSDSSDDIDATTAFDLVYAARKWLLPNLAQQCFEILLTDLRSENVCHVLNKSLQHESDIAKTCVELIEHNTSDVLKPENLQHASRQTMEAILRLDSLAEEETVIYDACVNWAKAQLKIHQSIDQPSDQQIREMIGELIYEIRFPTMDAEAFANLVDSSSVLSREEKLTILAYVICNHKVETMKFNTKKRSLTVERW